MRYIRYIAALVALVAMSACMNLDIDNIAPNGPTGSTGDLQVVGRITQYSDCNVATRSRKEGDEPRVTSMGLALFPIENGTIGNCLYYDFKLGGSIVFIVDRHNDVFKNYENKQFAMYIFANMQDAEGFPITPEAGVGKSLAYFKNCAYTVPGDVANVPESGFPMMGSLGDVISDADADGKTLILKPDENTDNPDGLPIVNGAPTDNLEIPLKSMYAKFSFTISSKPDQEIVGNDAPRFDLLNYTVHNVPATVDADSSTNKDTDADVANSNEYSGAGKYAQGATTATFSFYLPERYLTSEKELNDVLPAKLKKGTYDTTVDSDQNGYRDEDEKYHQRFKNKLPGDDQKATYLTIEGKYTDHQGHIYDVDYNIYLGGNNTDNFDIIRNTHYINSIDIRGISSSSDMSENSDVISIDWRVGIERSTPLVISFRRETLLDAHYEVRPLRLRLVGENIPTGTSATVEILDADDDTTTKPDWIRLEASGNTADYITSGVSAGKRKYFTTDLVTNTLKDGTSVTVNNLTGNNQAVWVYVDENTTTKSRAAIVRIKYDGVAKDYKIVQNGLFEVKGADSGRTYYIEQYEEYLYNYDAEESYGQTKDEGMRWGLNGVQLSNKHDSFQVNENNTEWNSYIQNNPLLKYDFYIGKHDDDNENSDVYTKDGGTLHNFAGQDFTKEIAENANSGVTYRTMGEQAQSAVEYCYNRNKRNRDGTVDVQWYLPAADELEDFIVAAYSSFKEFQDNYYWTSQPAYIRNAFYYEYHNGSRSSAAEDAYAFKSYEDNTEYARATKVVYRDGKYDYAPSGLNETPSDGGHAMDDGCISKNAKSLGYFNVMYGWYRWEEWSWSSWRDEPKTETKTMQTDDHFDAKQDGSGIGRYHVHLGHLYDMIQSTDDGEHGYHPRTKSNRVRCVRKVN